MSLTTATRKFNLEMEALLNKEVAVVTTSGKTFTGILLGYDFETKSICLGRAKSSDGEEYARIFIYGHHITYVYTLKPILDLKEFASILEKYFPKMVKYIEEARVITVMNKIRISEHGVEGTGPIAERIRRLFEEYVKEKGYA